MIAIMARLRPTEFMTELATAVNVDGASASDYALSRGHVECAAQLARLALGDAETLDALTAEAEADVDMECVKIGALLTPPYEDYSSDSGSGGINMSRISRSGSDSSHGSGSGLVVESSLSSNELSGSTSSDANHSSSTFTNSDYDENALDSSLDPSVPRAEVRREHKKEYMRTRRKELKTQELIWEDKVCIEWEM